MSNLEHFYHILLVLMLLGLLLLILDISSSVNANITSLANQIGCDIWEEEGLICN